jgi:YjbE family integral membrane protein
MEIMSVEFLQALLAIIAIDLVLAGDNAIVIGLAARNLPPHLQKKAIFWGAIGAVVVRAVLTMAVVWLLKIPGFLLMGGVALIWIAYQLVADDGGGDHNIASGTTFRQAIQTIVIADAIMGVDNVLAVAGAAHGSFLLVVIGLLVSIPIVMWGSTLILKLVERFPIIIVGGAGILGWTAAKMIVSEKLIKQFFDEHQEWRLTLYAFCIGIVICVPLLKKLKGKIPATPVCFAFTILWLAIFHHIEGYTKQKYYPDGNVPLEMYLIDLVMWVGWIPFVMMLAGILKTSPKAPDAPVASESKQE